MLTGLATVAILYGAGYAFARTAGFRALLTGRLERAAGVPVKIEGSRSSWRGDITLTGIESVEDPPTETPAVRIGMLNLKTSPLAFVTGDLVRGIRRAEFRSWNIRLVQDPAGTWRPAWLAGITDWLGRWGSLDVPVGATQPAPAAAAQSPDSDPGPGLHLERWASTVIALADGAIEWTDPEGTVLASIQDVAFIRTPLQLPTREAAHYHLRVGSASVGPTRIRELDVELLRTGDSYLVLNLDAIRQYQAPPVTLPEPAPPVAPTPDPARPRPLPIEDNTAASGDPDSAASDDPLRDYVREELSKTLRE